jgi:GAF domain-containing protein
VLGELIRNPVPRMPEDVARHPRSYGFPTGHPPIRPFLGVPILINGEAFGNLYLTEKANGPFDESDQDALTVLAEWAVVGARIPAESSVAGQVLQIGGIERLSGDVQRRRFDRHGLGTLGIEAAAALFVPVIFRTEPLGVLAAMDRLTDGPEFSDSDARLLEAFAISAATAVATARSVAVERRQQRLNAAEAERRRWARELHDETLQGLAMLRYRRVSGLTEARGTSANE